MSANALATIEDPTAVDLARLVNMRKALEQMTADDAAAVAEGARKAREWVRIAKGANAVALEATRLEFAALRRVAMGGDGNLRLLPAAAREPAKWLAEMTDATFAELLAGLAPFTGAVSVYRAHLKRRRDREYIDRGIGVSEGLLDGVPIPPPSIEEIAECAQRLVEHMQSRNQFTISDAAQDLARELELRADSTGLKQRALRDIVREAVAHADGMRRTSSERLANVPAFVTFCDEQLDWVRIPWCQASLNQFAFMVDYRLRQVEQLQAAVAPLAELLAELQQAHDDHPDLTGCSALFETTARARPSDDP